MPGLSLESLYHSQIDDLSSDFDQILCQFFKFQTFPSKEIVEDCVWREPLLSEDKIIENWKRLLAVNLLCDLSRAHRTEISAKVNFFERHPWNQSSQYFRSLIALNHALAKMPIPEAGACLLQSGAALIDLQEYSPWLSLPYTPQHFEFGIFICLLALLTKRRDLEETALRLVHWQMNTLDATGKPFSGLFVREKDGKTLERLCLSYLLFRGAAALSEDSPFGAIAAAAMQGIQAYVEQYQEAIDPLWPLIERWLEQYKVISKAPLALSEHIYDPSTALAGYRSSSQHVVCTLHGGHTGLGVLKQGDIEIVSYGPQYFPLAECQGFGIEGNALTDQGMRRSIIEWRRHSFSLKGCTRLVDQPSSGEESGIFRGIWLEVTQEFKPPHFYLKTSFLGLDGWDAVAFSFFVKAASCTIHSQQRLLPRTLERYEGPIHSLVFEGEQTSLELQAFSFEGVMQVIPLAGGNNFWGSDFLIAYSLNSNQRHYQWHIGPKAEMVK